jgi:hypothetical protein
MSEIPDEVNTTILTWLKTPSKQTPLRPEITEKIYECNKKRFDKLEIVTGGYKSIKILGCGNLILKDITTSKIEVKGSRFEMENIYIDSPGTALIAANSELKITNLFIDAKGDAIQMTGSKMDIVGANIKTEMKVVTAKQKSLIYWSLGTLKSPGLGTMKIHKRIIYSEQ